MPLSVAVSTFGSANGTIFAAGRLCYVASREGHLVDDVLTPAPALLFHALVAMLMILSGDIDLDILRNVYARAHHPQENPAQSTSPLQGSLPIPIFVLIMSIYLVLAPIVNDPRIEYVYSGLFMGFGGLLYVPFVRYRCKLPFMDKLTQWSQLLFKIIPPGSMPDC
ncbi:Uncharacterized protein FKW44_000656 [Caligus rogercresseyi]|uniref:B(0,+)-type amino acid transporter 1 n=1 Tax=Caligus rogercresseyi TaxID=217165 RepID=A0A7T8KHL7_CALRO|nr:Uncharacterized protein FKW44_000656 [Caligus rogercresseyi]